MSPLIPSPITGGGSITVRGDNGVDTVTGIASTDAGMPTTFISVESVS